VRDTRMRSPTRADRGRGADFQEMLARFKQGIDENIDRGRLPVALRLAWPSRRWACWTRDCGSAEGAAGARREAAELRGAGGVLLRQGRHVVAESILPARARLPASGDQGAPGHLYWLGRALEELGKRVEAREMYGRCSPWTSDSGTWASAPRRSPRRSSVSSRPFDRPCETSNGRWPGSSSASPTSWCGSLRPTSRSSPT